MKGSGMGPPSSKRREKSHESCGQMEREHIEGRECRRSAAARKRSFSPDETNV
ncbi:hypothetical protein ABG768_026991, partial [Culter alburnus]